MACDLVLVASVIDGHGSQGTPSPAQALEWSDPQARGGEGHLLHPVPGKPAGSRGRGRGSQSRKIMTFVRIDVSSHRRLEGPRKSSRVGEEQAEREP